jgi:hypothetical protein
MPLNVTFLNGPLGIQLPASSTWRISAVCGGDLVVPKTVQEAYRRLAEYMVSANAHPAGVASVTSGAMSLRFHRDYAARALQNSGAADLLRPYRRLGRN